MSQLPSELLGADKQFEAIVDHFKVELNKMRAGSATPALVENVAVTAYGTNLPLVQLASISIPEPRVIAIQPWDASMLKAIESALAAANLGSGPVVSGNLIRLSLPQLTQERRLALTREVAKLLEEHRERSRRLREELRERIQAQARDGAVAEDAKFRLWKEIDRLATDCTATLENFRKKKEDELLTV